MTYVPTISLPKRVLLAGVSTRAAAESAARARFEVISIDAFVDVDQHPSVRALPPLDSYSPRTAALSVDDVECDAVVYVSGFENDPQAVTTLAKNRKLWGNSPVVLQKVRNPTMVARSFHDHGHVAPAISTKPVSEAGNRRWLVKPIAGGGGHGVRPWRCCEPVPRGHYLQELVEGTPGSVVFVAANGCAVPLGVFRQLIGTAAFGATGYQYCGNILTAEGEEDAGLVDRACGLAVAVTEDFGLVGVNGVDFVACDGVPYPVEVNPRWCASTELVERVWGISAFAAHALACASGTLPEFDLLGARRFKGAVGKAVVFAKRDLTVGNTGAWFGEELEEGIELNIRDVPRTGERIRAGRPVCTVFAAGHDGEACRTALVGRSERLYTELAEWE